MDGIVIDNYTKEKIAKVNIVNIRTQQSVYNTLKADFKINVQVGDQLIVNKIGYFSDTISVQNYGSLLVYLKPTSRLLREVMIRDSVLSPQKRYMAIKKEYSKAYGSDAYRDVLSVSPGSGAGISIDALWNMLSRSGRNAQKLQNQIERDYRESLIDSRFNKTLVGRVTGLSDPQLTDFMFKYRPGYYQVMTANDYDFIASIKANLKRFRRNPKAFTLAPLPPTS